MPSKIPPAKIVIFVVSFSSSPRRRLFVRTNVRGDVLSTTRPPLSQNNITSVALYSRARPERNIQGEVINSRTSPGIGTNRRRAQSSARIYPGYRILLIIANTIPARRPPGLPIDRAQNNPLSLSPTPPLPCRFACGNRRETVRPKRPKLSTGSLY